jgi:drug/metabolite transporter (DMT)-like permease
MVTYEQPDDDSTSLNRVFDLQALVAGLTIAFLWGLMIYIEIIILKREDIIGLSYSAMKIFSLGLIGTLIIFLTGTSTAELKVSLSRKTSVKYLLIAGFVGWALGSVLAYTSFDLGPAAIINLIVGLNPIFAVIISLAIKMEKFSRIKFFGILLCIFSSILLVT